MNAAIDGELRLMDPGVRLSRSIAKTPLDPEFVKVVPGGEGSEHS